MSSDQLPMEQRVGYLIKLAQQLLRQQMDRGLRDLDLTAPQYAALAAIQRDPGISNAELARAAFQTPQTMQAILVNLEKQGFIRRVAAADHGRVLRSEMTASGRKALKEAHRVVNGVESKMLEGMEPEDIGSLSRLLGQCVKRLRSGGV